MEVNIKAEPRQYSTGGCSIQDYGAIHFQPGEMLTLVTFSGKECDVTATQWGFYLTPSINNRLLSQGIKIAIVQNSQDKIFINAVEIDKTAEFALYLDEQKSKLICWLDDSYITKIR